MKLKEIGTVTVAGILSLAALVLIEKQGSEPPLPEPVEEVGAAAAFHDSSVLIESSLPAPTAEPPTEGAAESSAVEAASDFTPVVADIDSDGNLITEDAPELSELDAGASQGSSSLAGVDPGLSDPADENAEDPKPTFSETFAETVGDGPTATEAAGEDEPLSIIEETPTGFWLREAKLNDVFQHLAQLGNHQFFHNAELEGPSFIVTGQLMDDDPLRQMEELALMYGVTIHTKGNTVYALTASQLSQLPTEPFRYQLKYLRPSDIEQIKLILQPFLTPGSGIIEYETKTNTLIVMDNERKLDALALFLEQIDQPKQQIAIETRILRITSSSRNMIGVDWANILGESGLSVSATSSLNALFNLPSLDTVSKVITATGTGQNLAVVDATKVFTGTTTRDTLNNEAQLVLNPLQLEAVLRALNTGGLAQQESSPTLIAEDNEEGLISIIDRVPIITATVTETTAGQNISEEVRYVVDENDPVGDPTTTREIGVSVAVTPTILPDNTIRMALRPRSAQVVDFVAGQTGNLYPRVNESTVTTTARVPNGHSLLIGGFYEETTNDTTNKVPVLGDIPAVNLLFKSTDTQKEHTSLVFIVTPKLYRPNDSLQNDLMSHEIHESHVLPANHDYPSRDYPGHNYRPDMRNTVNNVFRQYEPDPPSNLLHPAHPYNLPQAKPIHGKDGSGEPDFDSPSVTVRSAQPKKGLFGNLFGGGKKAQQTP